MTSSNSNSNVLVLLSARCWIGSSWWGEVINTTPAKKVQNKECCFMFAFLMIRSTQQPAEPPGTNASRQPTSHTKTVHSDPIVSHRAQSHTQKPMANAIEIPIARQIQVSSWDDKRLIILHRLTREPSAQRSRSDSGERRRNRKINLVKFIIDFIDLQIV